MLVDRRGREAVCVVKGEHREAKDKIATYRNVNVIINYIGYTERKVLKLISYQSAMINHAFSFAVI